MSKRFVLQMAGHPGSGKSAIARGIAEATGAVLVDKDVIKSPMVELDIEEDVAGPLGYEVFFAVGESIAKQGFSVVLDSPAYYPLIIEKGKRIAEETGADYHIVEVSLEDEEELQRRLSERDAMPSQIDRIVEDPYKRPGAAEITHPTLQLDGAEKPDALIEKALKYIGRKK